MPNTIESTPPATWVRRNAEQYRDMPATDLPAGVPALVITWIIALSSVCEDQASQIEELRRQLDELRELTTEGR
jgi:hypothetical protein